MLSHPTSFWLAAAEWQKFMHPHAREVRRLGGAHHGDEMSGT